MAAISIWRKLRLLLWKNSLQQRRRIAAIILEISLPIIVSALIFSTKEAATERVNVELINFMHGYNYTPFAIDSLDMLRQTGKIKTWKLVYAPKSPVFNEVMNEITHFLELDGFVGAQSSAEMKEILSDGDLVAGIEFHHPSTITELPKKLSYSLRFPNGLRGRVESWKTYRMFPPNLKSFEMPRDEPENTGAEPQYVREGFIAIQNAIAQVFVKFKSNNQTVPSVVMQRFPIPPKTTTVKEEFWKIVSPYLGCICIAFVFIYVNTVHAIVSEKERNLPELLTMMGVSSALQWTAWFIRTMITISIAITFLVILLSYRMYPQSNAFFLWILFFAYGMSLTTFSFMMSALFGKTFWAYVAMAVIWFATIIPTTIYEFEELTPIEHFLMYLSPNIAMFYAMKQLIRLEIFGDGLQWDNLWQSGFEDENLYAGRVMALMLSMAIVLFLLALYIESVLPRTFGEALPWYFPFTRAYWSRERPHTVFLVSNDYDVVQENFEEVPQNVKRSESVHIRHLRKTFPGGDIALDDISIDLYENQLTVLLGQNGSGKSTMISILSGMLKSTSGTVLINGHNLRTEMAKGRNSIGFCPEKNILFNDLTVREHIELFSELRGLTSGGAKQEVKKYTELLKLDPEKRSKYLSNGMKRKLSLAMALCGGSKFVLCDEPSCGMDPAARCELAKVLQNEKKKRIILLTTNYMDEADMLGDYIAIISKGRLRYYGSSFFLEKRFGAGYHLVCVRKDKCDPAAVTKLLGKYFPNISMEENIGAEIYYHLPGEDKRFFGKMFEDLENNLQSLHLSSFGVSLITLEDIFHKMIIDGRDHSMHVPEKPMQTNECTNEANRLLHGFSLVQNQWYALLRKKWFYWKRNWIWFSILNALTMVWVAQEAYHIKLPLATEEFPVKSLEITLNKYFKSLTILDKSHADGGNDIVMKLTEQYEKVIRAQSQRAILKIDESIDMNEYFLELSALNRAKANLRYMVGATFNARDYKIIAWFNGHPYHASPLSLNLVHNAIVKAMIGPDHSIHLYNHPFTIDVNWTDVTTEGEESELFSGYSVELMSSLITAMYITTYIRDRNTKSKLLLSMTGVSAFTYWGASLLWDLFTFNITIIVIILSLAPFKIHDWSLPHELALMFTVLSVFGIAALSITYIFSFSFKSPIAGVLFRIVANYVSGPLAVLLFSIIKVYGELPVVWESIFIAFPHYSARNILHKMEVVAQGRKKCREECSNFSYCNEDDCSWEFVASEAPGIGIDFASMFASGIFYFGILLLIESQVIQRWFFSISSQFKLKIIGIPTSAFEEVDADVLEEKKRVDQLLSSTVPSASNLIIRNLTRFYGSRVAVNRLSLSVEPCECVGVLGVSGAGKSTIFKMLTGDKYITDGDAWACGYSVKTGVTYVRKNIAYCPQFDVLLDDLTGRETLEVYGLLNGIRRTDINSTIEDIATKFAFIHCLDEKTSEYSSKDKRKLTIAIAFLGDPFVVCLDDPTAGLDPRAKRNIWNIINNERRAGKAILLSTHSMDECEALCSRLGIMVQGELKCLGSMQHLKNKFSRGHELTIKVKRALEPDSCTIEARMNDIMVYIPAKFPGATLEMTHYDVLTYYVPPSNETKWSRMFDEMESAKDSLQIQDYSIKQTSLEQVFHAMTGFHT